jgi:hypothetical protein
MREIRIKVSDLDDNYFIELLKRFPNAEIEDPDGNVLMLNEEQQKMIRLIDEKSRPESSKDWSTVRQDLIQKYGLN